jgi:hypothetical protein
VQFIDSGAILRLSWCGQSGALLTPDIYDPTVNPLYRDVLSHYGVFAFPCRVGNPDRKVKRGFWQWALRRRHRCHGCASRRSRRRKAYLIAEMRGADTVSAHHRPMRGAPVGRRAIAEHIHCHEGASGVRGILGALALAKKHGRPSLKALP